MMNMIAAGICDDYGLNDVKLRGAFAAHTNAMSNEVGQVMRLDRLALTATVTSADASQGSLLGRLKKLSTFLHHEVGAGTSPSARAATLLRTHTALGMSLHSFQAFPKTQLPVLADLVTELHDTGGYLSTAFVAYLAKFPSDAPLRLVRMREALLKAGGAGTTLYLMIHFYKQHGLGFEAILDGNVFALDRIRRIAPPNKAFDGFPQWGSGNAPDRTVPTNKKNHFLKHVLDSDPLGAALDWKDELRLWWSELGIKLERQEARRLLGIVAFAPVEAMFSQGGSNTTDKSPLPISQVVPFLAFLRDSGTMSPALANALYDRYGPAYVQYAVQASPNMADALVHATKGDPTTVYISGSVDDLFIIGRMQGAVLGISACYFLSDKIKTLGKRVKYWSLP